MYKLFAVGLVAFLPAFGQVKITPGSNEIAVEIDGKPYTTFFYGAAQPKPYLHPLRTASGTVVTRGFPMDKVEGELTDHPHHRGLWFAHQSVNGYDYWNNEFEYEKDPKYKGKIGHIFVTKVNSTKSGAKSGEISFSADWKQLDGKVVLNEDRKMTFYAGTGDNRIIDFDFVFTAKGPVTFGDEKDGVFGVRLAAGLEEPDAKSPAQPKRTGIMTNAQGCHLEKECWGARSEWMDYSGVVDGKKVGFAIFDNPTNPRFPTYWHARAYGLFASNIFGLHEFTKGKQTDGALTLKDGEKLHFQFRVLIHPGDTSEAKIAELYKAYTGDSKSARK
jgi:hypothetical protein